MQTLAPPSPAARRFDLDWLRIAAFGLLILYHVGMFYVTWDFHVKSPRASAHIEPLMLLLNPWRLGLLFLVAGAATAHIAARLPPGRLARARFHRLFWPLLAGMLIVVPPQSYAEIVEKVGWDGGFAHFYALYLGGYGGWCLDGRCLVVPTWNHLWFVAYALVYTLVAAGLLALGLLRLPPLSRRSAGLLFLVAPWLWLWAMRALLFPRFGSTHALLDDWYNHSVYLPLFLLGFAVARAPFLTNLAARVRWGALLLFAVGYSGARLLSGDDPGDGLILLARGCRELQAWAAIVAALGFARRHLATADGPARRILTRAVFPCYIVHQTAIVLAGHWLAPHQLPIALEAGLVVGLTLATCLVATLAPFRWASVGVLLGAPPRSAKPPAERDDQPAASGSAPSGP
jgi:hypothetical protein